MIDFVGMDIVSAIFNGQFDDLDSVLMMCVFALVCTVLAFCKKVTENKNKNNGEMKNVE